jgi:hypothetical protein
MRYNGTGAAFPTSTAYHRARELNMTYQSIDTLNRNCNCLPSLSPRTKVEVDSSTNGEVSGPAWKGTVTNFTATTGFGEITIVVPRYGIIASVQCERQLTL